MRSTEELGAGQAGLRTVELQRPHCGLPPSGAPARTESQGQCTLELGIHCQLFSQEPGPGLPAERYLAVTLLNSQFWPEALMRDNARQLGLPAGFSGLERSATAEEEGRKGQIQGGRE